MYQQFSPDPSSRSACIAVHPVSAAIADTITAAAVEGGHPEDPGAATAALRGPAAAAAIQGVLHDADGAVEHVRANDEAALQLATTAREHAAAAVEAAEERHLLPRESVLTRDGSDRTRARVLTDAGEADEAAARREARGDFEHHAQPPSTLVRFVTAVALVVIELFLLVVPVTNVSWTDPTSIAYMLGLTVLLVLMNDSVPRGAGGAIRDQREQLHAAWDTVGPQAVARRAARSDLGRTGAGQADVRRVWAAARRRTVWCAALGAVLAVYGALVFTRVLSLSTHLWATSPMGGLAAGLITACTIAAPTLMTWRWSRGNQLGDHMRECGLVLNEGRQRAADLAATAREELALADAAAESARRALTRAAEECDHIAGIVVVGIQIAASTPAVDRDLPACRSRAQDGHRVIMPGCVDSR